jgi:DNA-binding transcriptional LysR family regulator
MSHTTVARAMDDLEAHFGVRLFHRTTRRLTLTPDGERMVDHAGAILDQIDQAEAELAGVVAARGLVRVGVTTALGLHYAGRLAALRADHPELAVEMLVADWRDDAAAGGLDLWLRVGEPGGNGDDVTLGALPRILVAAPSYLDARGTPAEVGDLAHHDCLTYGYAAQPDAWPIDGEALRARGFLRANSSEAVMRAMRGGLGIALLPHIQVKEDLERGLIRRVLPDARIPPVPVVIAHPYRGIRIPVRAKIVRDFLIDHFPVAD